MKASKPKRSSPRGQKTSDERQVVLVGLSAAIVSVKNERPQVLVVERKGEPEALPFGNFDPVAHRTLESGLRNWVAEQTSLELGYVEQLYTFGDRGRHLVRTGEGPRVMSVGYLALTRADPYPGTAASHWRDWYAHFPWEDWREKRPAIINSLILPALGKFASAAEDSRQAGRRRDRIRVCFGGEDSGWDEEKVLERYELLYEARLVLEAQRDRGLTAAIDKPLGREMAFDHRRILATAMGRLRGKMKYRPVVFELMPPEFTLLELQQTVEAISGVRQHKQNFRRLVESQGLVERTGRFSQQGRGRPAEQFRFRREVLRERPAPGVRVGSRLPARQK
jgi:hypothetical protein